MEGWEPYPNQEQADVNNAPVNEGFNLDNVPIVAGIPAALPGEPFFELNDLLQNTPMA